jgi:hypothetical protein
MKPSLHYSHKQYDVLVENTIHAIKKLSTLKGGEYAGDTNRIEDFVRNAVDQGLEPEQIWRVYAAKHWDAIGQYVRDVAGGKDRELLEPIHGRADDLIVYLILFKAMVEARAKFMRDMHEEVGG